MTPSPSKGCILVCDDERGIRDILSRLVRGEGYEAVEAEDGFAALAVIRERAPDALFLDIRMPRLDGIEVLRRVKRLAPALPVVMITTSAAVADTNTAIGCGALAYLLKPFRHEDVIRLLERAMDQRPRHGASIDSTPR